MDADSGRHSSKFPVGRSASPTPRTTSSYGLFADITQQQTLILELPGLELTSGKRPEEGDLRRQRDHPGRQRSHVRRPGFRSQSVTGN
jgi:hypothetical protein